MTDAQAALLDAAVDLLLAQEAADAQRLWPSAGVQAARDRLLRARKAVLTATPAPPEPPPPVAAPPKAHRRYAVDPTSGRVLKIS